MKDEVKALWKVTLFAFVLTGGLFLVATGESFAGEFSKSCRNVSLQGSLLQAECLVAPQRPGQQSVGYRSTSLNLDNGISNQDGTLSWGGTNFSLSCRNLSLEGMTILKAECAKTGVVYLPGSLNLDERISNINGVLTFDRDGVGFVP